MGERRVAAGEASDGSRENKHWRPGKRSLAVPKNRVPCRGRGKLQAGPPVSEGYVRSDDATLLSRGWVLINHILMSKFGGFMFLRFAPVKKL